MDELITEIVSRAKTLRERIAEKESGGGLPVLNKLSEGRLQEWKNSCALDEEDVFRRRLANDNIMEEDLSFILSDTKLKENDPLPAWTFWLKEILAMFAAADEEGRDWIAFCQNQAATDDYSGIPFVHLLYPFALLAESRLQTDLHNVIFSDRVRPVLRKQLLASLAAITAQTFYLEFMIFRSSKQGSFGRLLSLAGKEPSDELYLEFVQKFHRGGWTGFFREYAVLAKLISITLDFWVRNTDALLSALMNDYAALKNQFSPTRDPGKIVKITSGISDSHWEGKKIHIITFGSGLKVVFKPRSLDLEVAFSDLLRQINVTALFPQLVTLDVLPRDGYGWVRFIDYQECSTPEQVRDYYRRTGMLICIVYILKGNDCHYENIIANGEFPVLIDLETIMHPSASRFGEIASESATFLAGERMGLSVYKTGLLPQWVTGKDDYTVDISGTGGGGKKETPYRYIEWNEVNTDRMNAVLKKITSEENANIPAIGGKRYLPSAFETEIVEGFSRLYCHFRDHKTLFRFEGLSGREVRFIFRNTRVYALIQKKLRNPKYLRSGIDRSIQLEGLSRAFLRQDEKNGAWDIFGSEIRQMEVLDIPIFTASSCNVDLCSGPERVVPDFLDEPVFNQVMQRLDLLSEDDLNVQTRFIRASLFFREYEEGKASHTVEKQASSPEKSYLPGYDKLVGHALKIGEQITEEAITSGDGTVSWISVTTIAGSGRMQMRPVSQGLYDGLSGLALFLSALYKVTGQEKYRDFSYRAVKSIMKTISVTEEYPIYIRLLPIGVVSGLTSIVYSMIQISGYLGDQELVKTAEKLAGMITPEYIREDKSFDVISGSSGAILGFIRLYSETGNPAWLEKAEICAAHLIRNRIQTGDEMCGWPSSGGRILSGFSHGAAGISYSLLRLYELKQDPLLLKTAFDAIRYEDSLYRQDNQNWQDLRISAKDPGTGKPGFMVSWCHGAPGIALGRLASLHILDNEQTRFDIDQGIEKTVNSPLSKVDHLCCGNLGRAEILFYAAGKRNDPDLKNLALGIAARTIRNRELTGFYSLYNQSFDRVDNLGFFQGLSGIGYQFLRFAEPEIIRPVLAFE